MKPNKLKNKYWIRYNSLFFIEHIIGKQTFKSFFGEYQKNLNNRLIEELKSSEEIEDFEIKEIEGAVFPDNIKDLNVPVVFRNAAENWNCNKKWNFDFFSEKFGDEDVILMNNSGLVKDSDQNYDVVKFKEYISQLKKGSKKYLKFSRIVEEKSDLINDIDLEWLKKFKTKFSANELIYFFMGGKGTITPIHNGLSTTIFIQIQGSKKWTFYPVNNRVFLDVKPERLNYFYSKADPDNLNDPDFPLLKFATPKTVTLNEGDILYFPSFVWHQVENLDDTIGVAYKFGSLFSAFSASKMLTACFLLATKPWIFETFLPWKPDSNQYVRSKENKKNLSINKG